MSSKMGRPTDNPLRNSINVRLDDECVKILKDYSEQNHVTKTEAVRKGIRKLKPELEEKK